MNEQVQINIDQDKIEARYADQAMISHNPFGVTIDFGQQIPQMKMIKIISRIAMSPEHAKAFLDALSSNIASYESKFGKIELSKEMKENFQDNKIGFKISKEN
jgi:hypothetical protein